MIKTYLIIKVHFDAENNLYKFCKNNFSTNIAYEFFKIKKEKYDNFPFVDNLGFYDPESGTLVWVQYPDDPKLRRLLLDAQIIYISYSNNQDYTETSYVEPLIRPYNQLKLLEQTKILYNINQAAIYKKFVIPIGGLSRNAAEQQIAQLMSEYHEDIQWEDDLGIVKINGSSNIPHSKDYWFPSSCSNLENGILDSLLRLL
jgi:hypothetical protein